MQWYFPFRRIDSGTRFGHTPAALCCLRRHLAALPAFGPGASPSAGGAPALLGALASGGAPALRGASAARGSPRSLRAERKEDGAIRRKVCYTCLLFAVTHVLFGGWSARVLFGGWSVTHVSYLPLHMSFSADGLHVSFSADGLLHLALLGLPDPAQTGTHSAASKGVGHVSVHHCHLCVCRRLGAITHLLTQLCCSYLSFLADGPRGP